ncbi:MAG TPA: HU family DNA-binding protein [Longimicrobium sp.]|nr:HU family DNA-binding protein [Longimicrobium sp.]
MREAEFIARVAEKAGIDEPTAARVVRAIFAGSSGAIAEALHSGERLSITGFGTFSRVSVLDLPAVVALDAAPGLLRRIRAGSRPRRSHALRKEVRAPSPIAQRERPVEDLSEAEIRAVLVAALDRALGLDKGPTDEQSTRPRASRRRKVALRVRNGSDGTISDLERRASIGEILRGGRGLEIEDVFPVSEPA